MNACFHLSGIYLDGISNRSENINKDMKKAFQYSVRACDLGSIHACTNVSIMYRKGDGVETNQDQSEKYKKLALEMKKELDNNKGIQFQQGIK